MADLGVNRTDKVFPDRLLNVTIVTGMEIMINDPLRTINWRFCTFS